MKTGMPMRYTRQGSLGWGKPRFRYRPQHPRRAVDGLLPVGGPNDGGCFLDTGAADSVYPPRIAGAPKTALPLSTPASEAGGRRLTGGDCPKWRRWLSITAGSMRYTNQRSLGLQNSASSIDLPIKDGRSTAYCRWVAEMEAVDFLETGRPIRYTSCGSMGPQKQRFRYLPTHPIRVVGGLL